MSNTTDGTGADTPADAKRAELEAMRMAELQALAAELQIAGAGRLRKGELVDAVSDARAGAARMPSTRRRGSRRVSAADPSEFAAAEGAAEASAAEAAESAPAERREAEAAQAPVEAADAEGAPSEAAESDEAAESAEGEPGSSSRSRRSRSRNRNSGSQGGQQQAGQQQGQGGAQAAARDGDDDRSGRGRTRDRKRGRGPGGDDLEPELLDDDVLIPVAGILDVLENYAFVRTTGYLPGPTDIYVSLGQVKKYGMRKGDAVVGAIRQPRENEQQGRQKYNALVKVDSINGQSPEQALSRPEFSSLAAVSPSERIRLEHSAGEATTRILDLFAPVGKGQRGLISGASRSGKTAAIERIAEALAATTPDAHVMVVLVDGRPEEVSELQRVVKGEVTASTFDHGAEDHVTIAELAIERAKRLVELGLDVVVLLDSITRLGRAYASLAPASRAAGGAVDPAALAPAKRLFASARALEEGGSLTILATALVDTGSRTDEAVYEELQGAANMELRLSRRLADERRYPAVALAASGTLREDRLMGPDEVRVLASLRRSFAGESEAAALESVLGRIAGTGSNVEFLMLAAKSAPAAG